MPFTLAHPAAVLPLARTPLPLSALVAGSMVPDLPLFVSVGVDYATTHTPVGVLTIDLVVGLIAWAAWVLLLRAPLRDGMPDVVRRRWPPAGPLRRGDLALALPAVVIGAATHVAWDEFTHAGRWGATHIAWLREYHGPFTGTSWAQYASGVGGLAVIGVVLLLAARARPPRPAPRRSPLAPWVLWAPAGAVLLVAVTTLATTTAGIRGAAFLVVTRGILAGTLALLVAASAWHVGRRRAGTAEASAGGGPAANVVKRT